MQYIRFRLDDLEKSLAGWSPSPLEISEAGLISLSDHIRKTYLAVASVGECDAIAVSKKTGRCRALESNYLNQLCRMGWLNKRKDSRTILFSMARDKAPRRSPRVSGAVDEGLELGQLGGEVAECVTVANLRRFQKS
jgi:hypothetical protein